MKIIIQPIQRDYPQPQATHRRKKKDKSKKKIGYFKIEYVLKRVSAICALKAISNTIFEFDENVQNRI